MNRMTFVFLNAHLIKNNSKFVLSFYTQTFPSPNNMCPIGREIPIFIGIPHELSSFYGSDAL
jgi:hypothetical protein